MIRLEDRGRATGSPRCSPTCRGSATRRCSWSFSATRGGSSGSTRAPGRERHARGLLQRDGRRRAGAADLHPRGRDPGARHLPDQRAAQPHRGGRARSSSCPTRCSRSPGCASAIRRSRALSACACRPRRPCIATATTIAAGRSGRRLRPPARRAAFDHGPAARSRTLRHRRVLRLVGGQGAAGDDAGRHRLRRVAEGARLRSDDRE